MFSQRSANPHQQNIWHVKIQEILINFSQLSVRVMKLFVQGKVSSTSNKNIEFKVDESTCVGYAQHLHFLETKAKKRAEQGTRYQIFPGQMKKQSRL